MLGLCPSLQRLQALVKRHDVLKKLSQESCIQRVWFVRSEENMNKA